MKITVIGGSGFVGTRLIDLLKEHHDIRNIDKQESHFHNEITRIGDVRDIETLKQGLAGSEIVVLLAAEHRDDISPVSLYYDVNVTGMKNVLEAMSYNNIKRIVFTSSVAVYGLNKNNPDETCPVDPFNHYGKSKWQAEKALQQWQAVHQDWNICVLRPTVIFGERNRGNVYNLLRQIATGKFLMIGSGENKKSMAYVGNIVAFIRYLIEKRQENGYHLYNYIDKPDLNMNELVSQVSSVLHKSIPSIHIPYWLGMSGGRCFDLLAIITRKKLTISSVRVKKFCATTQFDATKMEKSGFVPPYTLAQGLQKTLNYEFVEPEDDKNEITFISE